MSAVTPVSTPETAARAQELLAELAGPSAVLRDDQLNAIAALVDDRRRVLVVQRTGWGKSAVYFVATKLLRERGHGPTLLISPLLALMRDQIASASRMGLKAVTINSSNTEEWDAVQAQLEAGEVDLLAISPERLNSQGFVEGPMGQLAAAAGMVVIDEAHAVSAWGHDFRPDYMRIRDVLARLAPDTPVLATTATAPDAVVVDLRTQLGTEPVTLRGGLARESLHLSVVQLTRPAERLAWLAQWVAQQEGSGIIYTLTQSAAEQTAQWLQSQGINAPAYTGSTPTEDRQQLEAMLGNNEVKALVATSALGMGYDKSDLAFVVNLGAPSSITSYYQMVGRAGRGIPRADVVLLPGDEDQRIWKYFDSVSFPREELAQSVLDLLAGSPRPLSEAAIESRVDIRRGRLQTLLKVLDVEGAVKRVKGGWERTDAPWHYDEERYARVRQSRADDQQQMLEYEKLQACRMAFLCAALDDPSDAASSDCGQCDNCLGISLATEVGADIADAAQKTVRAYPIVLEPRRMWPTNRTEPKGRIQPNRQALTGRALTELGNGGWSDEINTLLSAGPDAVINEEILRAVAGVLKAQGWPNGRATWVTWIPSARRPNLGKSLAEELARVGKMELVDLLDRNFDAEPQGKPTNSAFACGNVWGAFRLRDGVMPPRGPGLLVDDAMHSGWTMTVVADLIQAEGWGPVYPLVLGKG